MRPHEASRCRLSLPKRPPPGPTACSGGTREASQPLPLHPVADCRALGALRVLQSPPQTSQFSPLSSSTP